MKNRDKLVALMISALMVLAIAPAAFADTLSGEATVSNLTPSVDSVEPSSTSVDPETYYTYTVSVSDGDTLDDIENVVLKLYYSGDAPGDSENKKGHYTFWFDTSDNTWHGPKVSANELGDPFLDGSGSSYPSDLSQTSGEYTFRSLLNGTASTAGSWNTYGYVEDSAGTSDNLENTDAISAINDYKSYSIEAGGSDGTINFSGSSGDTNVLETNAPTVVKNIETNLAPFDVQTRLDNADWKNDGGDTIGADNTSFEDASSDPLGGGMGHTGTMSTSFENVYTACNYGEYPDQTLDINYYFNFPSGSSGTYTNTFAIDIVEES